MPGKLTVCPTPIGNLGDITRACAKDALADADMIACEDTRRAGRLLELLEIQALRLVSYHERTRPSAPASSRSGSSAATRSRWSPTPAPPAISDPGYRLIRACIDRDLEIEVLPGPSAVTTALVASGLPTHRWRFQGFLPRRAGELERVLQSPETIIAFESPRRLPESLRGAGRPRARPPRGGLPRADQAARGDRARHPRRALAPLPRREPGRDRGRDRPRQRDGRHGHRLRRGRAARPGPRRRRPRAAASVVSALTGVPANDLYRGLTGRDPRR